MRKYLALALAIFAVVALAVFVDSTKGKEEKEIRKIKEFYLQEKVKDMAFEDGLVALCGEAGLFAAIDPEKLMLYSSKVKERVNFVEIGKANQKFYFLTDTGKVYRTAKDGLEVTTESWQRVRKESKKEEIDPEIAKKIQGKFDKVVAFEDKIAVCKGKKVEIYQIKNM